MIASPRAPHEDLYFGVEGARLRYRDVGSGCAVLLIHGWTLDLDQWEPQVEALAASFRVIRLDRRGFGLSSGRPSLAADVADLSALCRHLGLKQVAAVGMSQGARVAARLAAIAPELLSCIVLDGPPAGVDGAAAAGNGDVPVAEFRNLVRDRGMAAFRDAWARHPLGQLRSRDPGPRELLERMIARYRGEDLQEPTVNATESWDCPALESIRKPTLVITGALDLESRRNAADLIARKLPLAERAVVPDAGHLANLDNPQAYNTLLLRFLQQHAGARPPLPR